MKLFNLAVILSTTIICGCESQSDMQTRITVLPTPVPTSVTQQAKPSHPQVVGYPSADQVSAGELWLELYQVPECRVYQEKLTSDVFAKWNTATTHLAESDPKTVWLVARFKLHQDGSVSDIAISGETNAVIVSAWTQVVKACAPFPKWPDRMRSIVGREYLEIYFDFGWNAIAPPG